MTNTQRKGQKTNIAPCKEHIVCCGFNGRIVELYTMEQALDEIDEYLDELREDYANGEEDIDELDDDELDAIQEDIEKKFTYFNFCPHCGAELNKWWVRGSLRKCIDNKLDYFEESCENSIAEKLNENLDTEYRSRIGVN